MFGVTPFNRHVVRKNDAPDPFRFLIDDFFRDDFFPLRNLKYDTFKVDIQDKGDHYLIEADMPGVDKKDISLDYREGLLHIAIQHETKTEEENNQYIHRERTTSTMQRTLNLGELDMDQINASLKDGILTIEAPKAQITEKKSHIEIK